MIIAGTVKSGTTSLFRYLSNHSAICGSDIKETCFFLPIRYGEERRPMAEYESHFRGCDGHPYVLESTPGYFEGGRAVAQEIERELREARIVIVLRDPVDRLSSFFSYQKAQLHLPAEMTLSQYIDSCHAIDETERSLQANDSFWGVDGGRYANYLPDWFDVFPKERIRVLFFEDLVRRPVDVLEELGDWLRIDSSEFRSMKLDVENKTVHYKAGWLHKLAISANRKTEWAMSRAPALKKMVRSIYYAINAGQINQNPSAEELGVAEQLYSSDNRLLAEFLQCRGYSDLPLWLRKSES